MVGRYCILGNEKNAFIQFCAFGHDVLSMIKLIYLGCSGSPRLQRRRRARERRKTRNAANKDDVPDELAYIDSLPEVLHLQITISHMFSYGKFLVTNSIY